ncbi:undecaprenyl-diphosphatase UppP [candidate division WWE3 bacterium]|uniref:Undecaprenyl-diphosphatase n=1 Tax=candidate division WWE3 bacterium TaxID=2053526 RepID=A0A955RQG4_UNCKA|nr:undecaprenyl-diphosphatase UppP [candidate division WWE3 bacterium]
MSILQAIVLGIVQGITEFLPVSSSGHLILIPELFGWEHQSMDFDVMIHVATLCAVVWVMREDIAKILKGLFSKHADREGVLGWKILVATLPVVFVGLFVAGEFIDQFRTPLLVGVMLIVWGIILWVADWFGSKKKGRVTSVERISWVSAILIGCFQVFALLPGTSRSGSTISGGLLMGLDRPSAARFSFLLSIPAIAGAGLLTTLDAVQGGYETPVLPMIFGFIAAFISGMFAIRLLLALVQKISYGWFAGYRIIVGILLILFALDVF